MRLATFLSLMALSLAALAAPKAELWERWAQSSQNKAAIDHGAWNDFLGCNVKAGKDGVNRIAYGKVSKADRQALDAYVKKMQGVATR